MFRKSRSPVGVRFSSRVDVDARNGWPTLYAVETKGYTTLLQKFVSTAGETESLWAGRPLTLWVPGTDNFDSNE